MESDWNKMESEWSNMESKLDRSWVEWEMEWERKAEWGDRSWVKRTPSGSWVEWGMEVESRWIPALAVTDMVFYNLLHFIAVSLEKLSAVIITSVSASAVTKILLCHNQPSLSPILVSPPRVPAKHVPIIVLASSVQDVNSICNQGSNVSASTVAVL